MVNRAVSFWVAPLSFNLWTGNLWACQNAQIENKASWLASHQQTAPSVGDQAGMACIVICPAGKLTLQAYVAFQCTMVETSFKALIVFLARVRMSVYKLMFSELVNEQKMWSCMMNYCYENKLWLLMLLSLLPYLFSKDPQFLRPNFLPVYVMWGSVRSYLLSWWSGAAGIQTGCLITCEVVLFARIIQTIFFRDWVWGDCCL